MPTFLNSFMRDHRKIEDTLMQELSLVFSEAVDLLLRAADNAKEKKVGYTLFEAALIGIAHNRTHLVTINDVALGSMLSRLINSAEVSLSQSDTTATESVKQRISKSRQIFSK